MKSILVALAILSSCSAAHAMSADEYVQAVSKEIKYSDFALDIENKTVSVDIAVTSRGVTVNKRSTSAAFDAEILRAANAVLDSTVPTGIVFPVTYEGYSTIHPELFDTLFRLVDVAE